MIHGLERHLPATVVYLTVLAGSVVLVVLISMVQAMGERYPRRVQVAIGAGIVWDRPAGQGLKQPDIWSALRPCIRGPWPLLLRPSLP